MTKVEGLGTGTNGSRRIINKKKWPRKKATHGQGKRKTLRKKTAAREKYKGENISVPGHEKLGS